MNEAEIYHLKNSILKPYLIHLEFEVMNVENQINRDSVIKKALLENEFSIYRIETIIREFLTMLKQIQNIFKINK